MLSALESHLMRVEAGGNRKIYNSCDSSSNMPFIADLHIHSRYSRATSKELCFEQLHRWGQLKGVSLIGTGDFTHPAWFAEIKEKLQPGGDGVYRLKKIPAIDDGIELPNEAAPIRFIITGEISNIYKAGGKTRKVHNLVCMPGFGEAERFAKRLNRIGNINADGRPILGLDSRDLLEIALEACGRAIFIPAHIWTPWFSALGSKSGFNSIQECYRDLTDHIFAVETGLSSDPPMNWMVSHLDRFTLVSNSDSHSAAKIGREATLFACEIGYGAVTRALRQGVAGGYRGTLEFFPQEGKYHFDGHRACKLRVPPEQTKALHGRCPVCGKPLTRGVMYRVRELADRPEGFIPPAAAPFRSVVSLDSLLGEVLGAGPASKKVKAEYARLLSALGPELTILLDTPLDEIQRRSPGLLAEAVRRMREGAITATEGYDGEYGVIRAFRTGELQTPGRQNTLIVA
jgi:uncharacterized protein (TIGR00375 family)